MRIERRTIRRAGTFGLIALAGLLLPIGCAGPGGAGSDAEAVAYVRGDLEFKLAAGLDQALTAANAAITALGHTKLSEDRDATVAVLVSRDAEERRIQIRLESAGPAETAARIRVGILGDRAVSKAVMDEVRRQL